MRAASLLPGDDFRSPVPPYSGRGSLECTPAPSYSFDPPVGHEAPLQSLTPFGLPGTLGLATCPAPVTPQALASNLSSGTDVDGANDRTPRASELNPDARYPPEQAVASTSCVIDVDMENEIAPAATSLRKRVEHSPASEYDRSVRPRLQGPKFSGQSSYVGHLRNSNRWLQEKSAQMRSKLVQHAASTRQIVSDLEARINANELSRLSAEEKARELLATQEEQLRLASEERQRLLEDGGEEIKRQHQKIAQLERTVRDQETAMQVDSVVQLLTLIPQFLGFLSRALLPSLELTPPIPAGFQPPFHVFKNPPLSQTRSQPGTTLPHPTTLKAKQTPAAVPTEVDDDEEMIDDAEPTLDKDLHTQYLRLCRIVWKEFGIQEDMAWHAQSCAPADRVRAFEHDQSCPGPDLAAPQFWLGTNPKPVSALWNERIFEAMLERFQELCHGHQPMFPSDDESYLVGLITSKFGRGLGLWRKGQPQRDESYDDAFARLSESEKTRLKQARANTRRQTRVNATIGNEHDPTVEEPRPGYYSAVRFVLERGGLGYGSSDKSDVDMDGRAVLLSHVPAWRAKWARVVFGYADSDHLDNRRTTFMQGVQPLRRFVGHAISKRLPPGNLPLWFYDAKCYLFSSPSSFLYIP
ncbi:uncharacterized protein BXZ73DRAFT_99312 [Epithele typhae]|uniref:uncharacterized protein n=1 Tax=Epithele typhae TaxID=378194 RepID=UPI002008E841|nr:uncharacterized protein BXZ73DRAFT_99312 [Epithele typhae]KAH9939689.1 hypothetical protein BXZ73DRAFT_99312 [Epithele typhae]